MRKLAGDAIRDERMHRACGIEPAVRELRLAGASLKHELAEVRFDASGLLQAHEVRDYRHALELIGNPIEWAGMGWWAV
jgi:hypothetical protein